MSKTQDEQTTSPEVTQEDEEKDRIKYIRQNRKSPILMSIELLNDNPTMVSSGVNDKKNLYVFNGRHYDLLDDDGLARLYHKFVMKYGIFDVWSGGKIRDMIMSLKSYEAVKEVEMNNDDNYICLNNGVLHIATKVLVEHSPMFYFDTMINVDYDQNNKDCPHFKGFLDHVLRGDKDTAENIIQLGGYLLDPTCKANKMFLFDGPGANGKTTLLNTFLLFFSPSQITSLSLEDLAGKGFDKELLVKSRINQAGEQKGSYIDAEQIKQIIEGLSITVNRKFKIPLTFYPKTKIVMSCNGLPKFNDTTNGIYRRLLLFSFKNQYKEKYLYDRISNPESKHIYPQDPMLFTKIKSEKSAILNLFLDGLSRLRENNYMFVESDTNTDTLDEYKIENDTVREFLLETYAPDGSGAIQILDILSDYRAWYRLNVHEGQVKIRSNEIGRRVREVFNIEDLGKVKVVDSFNEIKLTRAFPLKKISHDIPIISEKEYFESLDNSQSTTTPEQSSLDIS